MSSNFWLTEEQFSKINPLLPNKPRGVPRVDDRRVLSGTRLDPLWNEFFPAEQARIVALLIARVDIGTDGLNVQLRIDGLKALAREMLAGDVGAAA